MNAGYKTPNRILAVVDDGHDDTALRCAVALADQHGSVLEVISCVEPPHDMDLIARLSHQSRGTLINALLAQRRTAIRSRLNKILPHRKIEPHIAFGKAFIEIVRHVTQTGCDFVVKLAEPLAGIDRFLFSSTDQHLLRNCRCPVWIQTSSNAAKPRRIVAAVDLDTWDAAEPDTLKELNVQVVNTARQIAFSSSAEIFVLHVWNAVGEGLVWAFSSNKEPRAIADLYVSEVRNSREQAMKELLASVSDDVELSPTPIPMLKRGTVAHVIQQQCQELGADVVVIGTIARTGLSGVFVGNTAENIINSLGCSLVAIKPESFVGPPVV